MMNGYWVPAICPSCGANISVSKDAKHAHCPYCGSNFMANEATARFSATYMTNLVNANVAYFGDSNKDFEIVAGELKRYNGSGVDVVIPDGVETIGFKAFKGQGIHSVRIPNSTKIIGFEAFSNCNNLAQVDMPKVEKISGGAFSYCSMLTSVDLPATLKEIEDFAFAFTKLRSITIGHKGAKISNCAFNGSSLEKIIMRQDFYDFFSRERWPNPEAFFTNLDNLNAIAFNDYTLTPDRLELDYSFESRDEYNLFKSLFSYNKPFASAMNRRIKKCMERGICPICDRRVKPAYVSGVFTKHSHPAHCNNCNSNVLYPEFFVSEVIPTYCDDSE